MRDSENAWRVLKSPYGVPGDRLWVREAWRTGFSWDDDPPSAIPVGSSISYEADQMAMSGKYRQGMFMPRWASRITLEVIGVRVERVQGITGEDAKSEGAEYYVGGEGLVSEAALRMEPGYWSGISGYRFGYKFLWDSINSKRAPWSSNPWVWVLTFKPADPGKR